MSRDDKQRLTLYIAIFRRPIKVQRVAESALEHCYTLHPTTYQPSVVPDMNPSLEELEKFAEQLAAREAIIAVREAELNAEHATHNGEFESIARDVELAARNADFIAQEFAAEVEREVELRLGAARQEWEEAAATSRHNTRARQEDGPDSELKHTPSQRESFVIKSSKVNCYTYWIHLLMNKCNR